MISREGVTLAEKLGGGASGDVYGGVYQGRQVAVKVKAEDTRDDPCSLSSALV